MRGVMWRLLDRIGNPLEWNDVDKALVVQVIQAPMVSVVLVRGWYLLGHPELEPYYDRGMLALLVRMLLVHVVLTVALVLLGLWVRRGRRGARVYCHAVVQYWWLVFAWIAYIHGPPTTPIWAIFPIVGFFTLLLFDVRLAVSGIATAVVFLYATALAERAELVPYAPLFSAPPMVGSRVSDEWYWSSMIWPVAASGVTFVVFVLILRLNRRQAEALAVASRRMRADVEEAARYVRSVLPSPLEDDGGVSVEWTFVPSAELGGDAFTYGWVDDQHFMIALLDVCGHGIGSALHGISALHALRQHGLPGADLRDPAAVATAMNAAFAMHDHGDLYLTLWYGVYHRPTRLLRYTTGGHPPAVLVTPSDDGTGQVQELGTRGLTIGITDDAEYEVGEARAADGAALFVFSDGAFEVEYPDGGLLPWDEFLEALASPAGRRTTDVLRFVQRVGGRERLEDDFSLVRVEFSPSGPEDPCRSAR